MSAEHPSPVPPESGRRSPGRVLAAIWLGISQAIVVGILLLVAVVTVLLDGFEPFSSVGGDPTFGFLSGITLRTSLPFLGVIVVGGAVLGIVVGSGKLWTRRMHGRAVLVSSLPLLLFALVLVIATVA